MATTPLTSAIAPAPATHPAGGTWGATAAPPTLEIDDIQGLVVRGYGNLRFCSYVLLQITGAAAAARRWVGTVAPEVARGTPTVRDRAVQLAFTHSGFAALGVPSDTLRGFSPEFVQGMVGEHRSRFLGDVDESAPSRWQWGGSENDVVHAVLMLYASTEAKLLALYEAQREAWSQNGLSELHVLHTSVLSQREHFGFVDGISQPAIEGYHRAPSDLHVVKAGEFVLGYPNEYGLYTGRPMVDPSLSGASLLPRDVEGTTRQRDFGRNGTYLVMRQLRQNVPAFRATLASLTQHADGTPDPAAQERLAAQMVGRWPSGAPLTATPDYDDGSKANDNEFRYHRDDADGLRCPVGAHIRRANPRDSLAPSPGTEKSLAVNRRHRLLRRGRGYGPPLPPGATDDADRGLIFVALNANLVRQFEFVQHSWLGDPRFNGLDGEADPLVGSQPNNAFTVPANPLRRRCDGLPRFVTVAGGAYFFLPGIRALRFLAELNPSGAGE